MNFNRQRHPASLIISLIAIGYSLVTLTFPSPIHATNYYVAPTGNDTNPGTLAQPWRTLGRALNNSTSTVPTPVRAGDTVYLRDGTYSEGNMYLNGDGPEGENGNYIQIKRYQNETPTFTSTHIRITDRDYMLVEGLTFRDVQATSLSGRSENEKVTGLKFIDNTFYNNVNPPTPHTSHIRVSTVGGQTNVPSVYIRYTDVLVQGNHIFEFNEGLADDAADSMQLEGNVDYARVINNYLENTTSIGIVIAGRHWKNNDPFITLDTDDLNPDQMDYVIIKGNTVDSTRSNSIYLDMPGDFFVVEDNKALSAARGIIIAGEGVTSGLSYEHGIVRRNLVYNNFINTIIGTREVAHGVNSDHCWDNDPATNDVPDNNKVVYVHNTGYVTRDVPANVRFQCARNHRFKNNILATLFSSPNGITQNWHYQLQQTYYDSSTWQLDRNLFYSGDSHPKGFFWIGVDYPSLTAFRGATGFDTNSLVANPEFTSIPDKDFTLKSNSPAIDAGYPLTTTTSGRTSSTALQVADATYFTDGIDYNGGKLIAGDWIRIGSGSGSARRQVIDVNYSNNTITLSQATTWSSGAAVTYDFAGSSPDLGAFESGYTAPPTPTSNPNTSPTPSATPVPPSSTPHPSPLNLLPGDANGDNLVNLTDYNIILSNFGRTGNIPRNQGDLDGNGAVNLQDFNQVVSNFGS